MRVAGRAKRLWLNASHNLGVIPGFVVLLFAGLGVGLVEVDRHIDLDDVQWVFSGNGSAARTVLSVIAGSLITVAGLTFSITMVVLQLASSQFSPRILRTFFGDRVTQVTIGTFVGTFVYSILVLRAVGSVADDGFVPRLSVSVASLLGIGSAVLLIVFLRHVSQLIQVSHVTASIAHDALKRIDDLYADRGGEAAKDENGAGLLRSWRDAPSGGRVFPPRPGYVQRVDLQGLPENLDPRVECVAILVCPGDFVSVETPIAEFWSSETGASSQHAILDAVSVASERDLDQDVDFGLRQLTDIALKAMSPGINDPTTAVTCIGYLRAILVRLTERDAEPAVRELPGGLTLIVRRRAFAEYFESLLQISRYVDGDAWVAGEMLLALCSCAGAARDRRAAERLRVIRGVAVTIAEQAVREAKNERDRVHIEALAADVGR